MNHTYSDQLLRKGPIRIVDVSPIRSPYPRTSIPARAQRAAAATKANIVRLIPSRAAIQVLDFAPYSVR